MPERCGDHGSRTPCMANTHPHGMWRGTHDLRVPRTYWVTQLKNWRGTIHARTNMTCFRLEGALGSMAKVSEFEVTCACEAAPAH